MKADKKKKVTERIAIPFLPLEVSQKELQKIIGVLDGMLRNVIETKAQGRGEDLILLEHLLVSRRALLRARNHLKEDKVL